MSYAQAAEHIDLIMINETDDTDGELSDLEVEPKSVFKRTPTLDSSTLILKTPRSAGEKWPHARG